MDSHAEWSRDMSACILITCEFLIKSFAFSGRQRRRRRRRSNQTKATHTPAKLMNRAQVLNATHYSHSCTKCSSIELTAYELMRASERCDLLWNFVDETTVRPLLCAFHVVQVHVPHKGRMQCVPFLRSWCERSWVTMRNGRK